MSKQYCNLCNKHIEKNIHVFSCNCDGVFHKECLENFYKYNNNCPQCNKNYYTDNHNQIKIIKVLYYRTWNEYDNAINCMLTGLCCMFFCNIM